MSAPMNSAHKHAAKADDYLANGLLVMAREEYGKAGKAYMESYERSHDKSARRTLRMLYDANCKAEKDLKQKIENLEGKGLNPNLQQNPESIKNPIPRHPAAAAYSGPERHTASPPRNLTDSQNTVDESFMLLGGQKSDPGDAFNQFWTIMQGMLDNLSQPVAFATVPLGNQELVTTSGSRTLPSNVPPRRDGSLSSDTDPEDPMFTRLSKRIGLTPHGNKDYSTQPLPWNSTTPIDDFDEFLEEGDELSESFFVIPSKQETIPAALKKENVALKAEIGAMYKRLEAAERVIQLRKEQDAHLRDSIVQATREAQRVMGASAILQRPNLDLSNLNLNVPPVPLPGFHSGREAQYQRRVKELEDEVRLVRAENEKHKAMISKFRERWEKLKESAKRKKEAKAAAEALAAPIGVQECIVEEPEAEEALDGAQ